MWVGVDDTDSPSGGCTTWVLTELVRVAREHRLNLVGEPGLVRLNPNVPWKTRGNAALRLRLGHGKGRRRTIGSMDAKPVACFARGAPLTSDESDGFFDDAWRRVVAASPHEKGTDPALVASPVQPPAALYWSAVREIVTVEQATRALRVSRARWRTRSGRRGLIGAAAALAWPGRRGTWELIAYRPGERVGRPREVDMGSVLQAQREHPDLFLCHDARTRRLLVSPHTPCPILFGLRGTSAQAPLAALPTIRSERVERWLLFRTNQATGDHLVERSSGDLRTYRSGVLTGTVAGSVAILKGGHVRFSLRDSGGRRRPSRSSRRRRSRRWPASSGPGTGSVSGGAPGRAGPSGSRGSSSSSSPTTAAGLRQGATDASGRRARSGRAGGGNVTAAAARSRSRPAGGGAPRVVPSPGSTTRLRRPDGISRRSRGRGPTLHESFYGRTQC